MLFLLFFMLDLPCPLTTCHNTRDSGADKLRNKLLSNEYSRCLVADKEELLQEDHLTVQFDGYTTREGRSVYAFVVTTTSGKPYVLKLQDLSDEKHTGENLAGTPQKPF